MLKTENIRIRDPYIVEKDGEYYMYSSTNDGQGGDSFPKDKLQMIVYKSYDLENWSEPKAVFTYAPSKHSRLVTELWAPEVHLYEGRYYALMSFKNNTGKRGTYIAVSDKPDGEFTLLSETPQTPEECSCIDGTLYVEDGTPYIVYSLDWPHHFVESECAYVGEIWARELSPNLSRGVGEPFRLFSSNEAPISRKTPHVLEYMGNTVTRYGSDAPFLTRLSDGTLLFTWSPYLQDNYVVLGAVAEQGKIRSPYRHLDTPVFDGNGGHAMFFREADGSLKMCIHCPEREGDERMLAIPINETELIDKCC